LTASHSLVESSQGKGGLLGHDAISADAKAVHSIGQPISISTNCGFSTRPAFEEVLPCVEVGGAGREFVRAIASKVGRIGPTRPAAGHCAAAHPSLFGTSRPSLLRSSVVSFAAFAEFGVGH
jgi:hypothetical protein